MSKKELVNTLKANRLMQSLEEFERFEKALEELARESDLSDVIVDLYLVLDDDCEQFGVMWGLLHFLESIDLTSEKLIIALPQMVGNAKEWVETLLVRIMNSPSARSQFRSNYQNADLFTRDLINTLLNEIANEDSKFKPYVSYITS